MGKPKRRPVPVEQRPAISPSREVISMRRRDINEILVEVIEDAVKALTKARFDEHIERMHTRIHAIEERMEAFWWEQHGSEIDRAMAATRGREEDDEIERDERSSPSSGRAAVARHAPQPSRFSIHHAQQYKEAVSYTHLRAHET